MVKPGCDLNNLLESAKSVLGSLTRKYVILMCGGSNDFNFDKDQSIIDRIMDLVRQSH